MFSFISTETEFLLHQKVSLRHIPFPRLLNTRPTASVLAQCPLQCSLKPQLSNARHREGKMRKRREAATELLKARRSIRDTSSISSVSRSTAQRIKSAYEKGQQGILEKLLDPLHHFAGRQEVLRDAEEELICNRAVEVSRKGFEIDMRTMQSLQAKISNDGRRCFCCSLPSLAAIRSFRARNRSLAYRNSENITAARLGAENTSPVATLKEVLLKIGKKHPGILEDPNRL